MISALVLVSTHVSTALTPQPSPSPTQQKVPPDQVSAGLLGFIVFAFLAGAAFLLWRSMNTQMKRVPDSFDVVDNRDSDPDLAKGTDAVNDVDGSDPGSAHDSAGGTAPRDPGGTAGGDPEDPREPPTS